MTQNPEFLGNWILALAVVASLALNIMALAISRRVQKREVSFTENFATTDQLARVEADVERVAGDVRQLKDSIIANGEERRIRIEQKVESVRKEAWEASHGLHERIAETKVAVAKLESLCEENHANTNQQIVLLGSKLDRFLERQSQHS